VRSAEFQTNELGEFMKTLTKKQLWFGYSLYNGYQQERAEAFLEELRRRGLLKPSMQVR